MKNKSFAPSGQYLFLEGTHKENPRNRMLLKYAGPRPLILSTPHKKNKTKEKLVSSQVPITLRLVQLNLDGRGNVGPRIHNQRIINILTIEPFVFKILACSKPANFTKQSTSAKRGRALLGPSSSGPAFYIGSPPQYASSPHSSEPSRSAIVRASFNILS
jgi:hypothetical protein